VLLRAIVKDDAPQSRAAMEVLENAGSIVVGLQVLCELAWVLDRHYKISRTDVALIIQRSWPRKELSSIAPSSRLAWRCWLAAAILPMV
jgi:predicted nucleic-acid-binding protein